jgi:hypothetical protein
VLIQKEGIGKHLYHQRLKSTFEGAWHLLWKARLMGDGDTKALFDQGQHFWRQKDLSGIRIKPIEAIDFFRRAAKDPAFHEAQFALTCALLYRYVYGETAEFEENLQMLIEKAERSNPPEVQILALYYFALIWIEMRRLNIELIPIEQYQEVMLYLGRNSLGSAYVEAIHMELDSAPVDMV